MIEPLLLTAVRLVTFNQQQGRTNATGFLFERGARLFLVTSRHVMRDEPTGHRPDRIEIELHINAENMAETTVFSIPLYSEQKSLWRQGTDSAGEVDVAVIEIQRQALPKSTVYRAFSPAHLCDPAEQVEVGSSLLVVGFPLGFQDTLHRTPVVRQAVIASSFGLRFQGQGFFLTDARTHRGSSGAPVVMRIADPEAGPDAEPDPALGDLPWRLLGVHSARLDVAARDIVADEALGLNCAWYADILMTLTES